MSVGAVTVVVPVRDETQSLVRLLDSIRAQTRAPDEIVIVDAGSADGTPELARTLTSDDRRFRVVSAGEANPGTARNVGVQHAVGEWIAFTDAGIQLVPTWLEELEAAAEATPRAEVVYGNYEVAVDSLFSQCAALAYVAPRRASPSGPIRQFLASSMVTRRAWASAGGFPNHRAGEDTVFMERLAKLGVPAAWAPGATVYWSVQPDVRRTFRRFRLYSYHGVLAGREANWHYGVARLYLGAAAIAVVSRMIDRRLVALLPLGALARVVTTILQRRDGRRVSWALQPKHIVGVATILATCDAALFVGWCQGLAAQAARAAARQTEGAGHGSWRRRITSPRGAVTARA